jgi:hypothetical protein
MESATSEISAGVSSAKHHAQHQQPLPPAKIVDSSSVVAADDVEQPACPEPAGLRANCY